MTAIKKLFFALILLLNCTGILVAQSSHSFYFDQPAAFFEETFVLGNGKTGATVFGRTDREIIYLNDATLWSGEPVNANMNPQAHTFIPEIREALRNENYPLAEKMQRKVQGTFSQSYAPLGTAYIHFDHKNISNYRREINLREAIAIVDYNADGIKFSRSYYVSYPDKVVVIKLNASQKGSLNFSLNFDSQLRHEVSVKQKTLFANGQTPYKIEPNYRRNVKEPVLYDAKRGTRFSTQMKIKNTDGKISVTDSSLVLKNATEAIIYISLETSFNGFDRNPMTEGKDARKTAATQLKKAFAQKETKIRKRHTDDFGQFYNRVSLSLGKRNAPDLPINERLKRYALGKEDKNLEILFFNFVVTCSFLRRALLRCRPTCRAYGIPTFVRPGAAITPPTSIQKKITGLPKQQISAKCINLCLVLSKICRKQAPSLHAISTVHAVGFAHTTPTFGL